MPSAYTDNTGGRPLNAQLIAKQIVFLFGPEILKRLEQRRRAGTL